MPNRIVLVTGAEGLIGGIVRERLADRYELRALTRRQSDFPSHVADVADYDALAPALAGVDAVVHLAASAEVDSPWDAVLSANLVGARNVLEAAQRAGTELVVFASSNHAVGMYELEGAPDIYRADKTEGELLPVSAPARPDSLYGASKVWGEALGRYYAERVGSPRVICLRIGWVSEGDSYDPAGPPESPDIPGLSVDDRYRRMRAMWLSHADCASLIAAALEAPASVRFGVVYGVSGNAGRWFSLDAGLELLGWQPRDGAPA
ncbi:MAG TPA: NAD(P)-dependent oxidoreductase [Candidatus Limnocylindria bacterium]|nr:NAD(P)-dependent oxidoreductase [Candidatus Limnocylindria bacterium]